MDKAVGERGGTKNKTKKEMDHGTMRRKRTSITERDIRCLIEEIPPRFNRGRLLNYCNMGKGANPTYRRGVD